FFKKIKYDIIHFEFSGLGVTFLPIIPKLRGKKVVSCRGTAEKVKLTLHADRKDGLAQLFQRVDMIHCVSDDMKNTVLPYCRDASKIFVNRPAIDPDYFKPELMCEEGDANTVKILTIIRLAFVKGVLIGLLAVRTLVRKGIPVHWNIIGDGPQKEEIMFHIHYLGLEKHVSLLGRKPKEAVNDALNRTDIFMLTSYSEGIPNVVLEAMSKEKPVVSTRCGGVEEVIDHGIDGFIAEMYDHDAVATYVERLALDKSLRQQIGVEARKKVLAEYTLSRQVKVFEENYHLLLSE
ncbi:MAG: glycosyltransferase family 4 protein, partial [Bacteroidota bacterium]|nr:glycosyltransferase family 4 protein [Bacteroidota bacterium]